MSTNTKFVLTYIGGFITGIILTFIFMVMAMADSQENPTSERDDIVMFDNPQQEIKATSFKVIQVLPNGNALAKVNDWENLGLIVLFLADKNMSYYDDQKIEVSSGKKAMQIGTFRYITRENMEKTVPIVEIIDK